ncbi:MAG TPA: DUF2958 domain-containing protein [Oligoflexia bacterium]|nr:DUF2958 domain-containing protein [Oligoflexia bacterium]
MTEAITMNLMTDELKQQMPALYSQEHEGDPLARVKFFTPWAGWTWYGIEFDGEDLFFGFVDGLDAELGYFSLAELETIQGPGGLRIERDLYFQPTPLSKLNGRQLSVD